MSSESGQKNDGTRERIHGSLGATARNKIGLESSRRMSSRFGGLASSDT